MTAEENKSDLSFNTVIPNSFNVRTTNPFSLTTAMSPTDDPESTALLVDVDRNDVESVLEQELSQDQSVDIHTAPSTTSQQSYVHLTSCDPGPARKKGPRFGRVIKYLNWTIVVFIAIALMLLLTYKIIIGITTDFVLDTTNINHDINWLGLMLCIVFVCSVINILTTPPLLINMLVDLILPSTLFHFSWSLNEATLGPKDWCDSTHYWSDCLRKKDSCYGLEITVLVLSLCFALTHIALLVMRSILYFEGKTWKSPVRLPVGDYRLEFRVKIVKDGEEVSAQEV